MRGEIEIRAGSHHEPEEDYGVMHFLEHMTFNGSARHLNAQEREERAIIQAERKEREQKKITDYTHVFTDFIRARLCANNPAHYRDGIGTQSTIDAITAEKLRRYHKQYFCGANAIVSLVGDLNSNNSVLTNVVASIQRISKGQYAGIVEPRPEILYNGREVLHIPSSPSLLRQLILA